MKKQNRHVPDTVLMFEGGGMRASYTSAMASLLMEQGVTFDYVCGISAGASNTVNFLSGDIQRTRESFVDLVMEPEFGGLASFLKGKGVFSAEWIYEEVGLPGGVLPFKFDAFWNNPAKCAIQGFDRDTGETVVWHKEDMATLQDLMIRVRASSTLPFVMPAVHIGERVYYDGGLGQGAGIPLQLAIESGCSRIFAILTRPKGFRKPEPDIGRSARMIAHSYRKYPYVREALLTRNERYNAELEKLEQLAKEGKAYIVYSDKMAVDNNTTDLKKLRASYFDGYTQAQKEFPQWLEWLGVK